MLKTLVLSALAIVLVAPVASAQEVMLAGGINTLTATQGRYGISMPAEFVEVRFTGNRFGAYGGLNFNRTYRGDERIGIQSGGNIQFRDARNLVRPSVRGGILRGTGTFPTGGVGLDVGHKAGGQVVFDLVNIDGTLVRLYRYGLFVRF